MTINVMLMILALAIGLGTSQSIERSDATVQYNWVEKTDCYINGIWYNPCPDPESLPPHDPRDEFHQ